MSSATRITAKRDREARKHALVGLEYRDFALRHLFEVVAVYPERSSCEQVLLKMRELNSEPRQHWNGTLVKLTEEEKSRLMAAAWTTSLAAVEMYVAYTGQNVSDQ